LYHPQPGNKKSRLLPATLVNVLYHQRNGMTISFAYSVTVKKQSAGASPALLAKINRLTPAVYADGAG